MANRFPRRLETWMSEEFADAVESIAHQRALSSSAVVREALLIYLSQLGALRQQQPNAQAKGQANAVSV